MKKTLISLAVVVLVVPQIALASWWNPISWFRKQPAKTATQESSVKTATSTASEIENLQKRIDDLKKQQPVVPATTASVIKKKTEKLASPADNSETIKAQVRAQVEVVLKAKVDQEALIAKQKADEQSRIDLVNAQLSRQLAEQAELNKLQVAKAAEVARVKAAQDAEKEALRQEEQRVTQLAATLKQEKLNAVNKKIADLNAKYLVDLKAINDSVIGRGITSAGLAPQITALNRQYDQDYAALTVEYQQIQYSN